VTIISDKVATSQPGYEAQSGCVAHCGEPHDLIIHAPGTYSRDKVAASQRERLLYSQPTGPNPLYRRDD